jgi:hypothetical protein
MTKNANQGLKMDGGEAAPSTALPFDLFLLL